MKLAGESDLLRLAAQLEAAATIIRSQPNCSCSVTRKNEEGEWEDVSACASKAHHAVRVARQASGFIRSAGGGGSRPSGVSKPTEASVFKGDELRGRDGPEWWHYRLSRDAMLASRGIADLIEVVAELGKVTKTDPKALTKTGQGDCPVCDAFCSGAAGDRLVAGFCDTDYRAWCRAGRPERAPWVRARRLELANRRDGAA